MRERNRSDPEVVRTDHGALSREVGPDLGVDACHRLRDRKGVETGKEVFDECTPLGSPRSGRSMDAVQQLAHRDHTDRTFLVAGDDAQLIEASFAIDEENGVD